MLFTAGHIILEASPVKSYFCCLRLRLVKEMVTEGRRLRCIYSFSDDGEAYPVFPVRVVLSQSDPDFAILRRTDNQHFTQAMRLCEPSHIPWMISLGKLCCKTYVFHCTGMNCGGYILYGGVLDNVFVRATAEHYFMLDRAFLKHRYASSSGGAVVLRNNTLLGILVKRVSAPPAAAISTVDKITSEKVGLDTIGGDKDLEIADDDGDSDISSLSAGSAGRTLLYPDPKRDSELEALIPSVLRVRYGGSSMPLAAWLKLPPAEMILDGVALV